MHSRKGGLVVVVAGLLVASAALFAVGVGIERSKPHREAGESAAQRAREAGGSPSRRTTEAGESPAQHAREVRAGSAAQKARTRAARARAATAAAARQARQAREAGESPAQRAREAGQRAHERPTKAGEPAGGTKRGDALPLTGAAEAGERIFGINPDATGLVVAVVSVSVLLAILLLWRPRSPVLLIVILGLGLVSAAFDIREALHQADESNTDLVVIASIVAALHLTVAALAAGLLVRRLRPDGASPREASTGPTG